MVALSGAVNASFRIYGRRRRVVEIGYPLWLILTPQERVALLAHEMAHSSNGDGRHGLVVSSAMHSLGVLHDVTRFDWQPGARAAGAAAMGSLLDGLATRAHSAVRFLETSAHFVKPEDLWASLRAAVDGVPDSELERRRRAGRLEELRVDQTHPATYLRMEWVAGLAYPEARVRATEMEVIERELERPAERVARAVREDAQSALYH
ncbi:hypothetical protein [Nonomuraea sp. NPDC050643]|uniref:hypothetical protein n=1 Tax=Nonomuraea sp. NPDC050643 TaxID=3155660 RepID=UPI0033E93365